MEWLCGPDVGSTSLSLSQIAVRAAILYTAGLVLIRLGKSRLLGRATPLDVIIGFTIGSLLSRGINGNASLLGSIIACAVLVGLHWVSTFVTSKHHRIGALIKGSAHPLVVDGVILWDNLRRAHMSIHDLEEELRLNANLDDPSKVKVAFEERCGEIGVVKKDPEPRIIEVNVLDGAQTIRIVI